MPLDAISKQSGRLKSRLLLLRMQSSDEGSGLMHARYYDDGLGRFLSVDPVLDTQKALKEPQRWNRYSYVTNNPLRYVDPDGREMRFSDYASAVWDATKETADD